MRSRAPATAPLPVMVVAASAELLVGLEGLDEMFQPDSRSAARTAR